VFLYENIQHLTVLIHNPPEIMAFAIDGDKDLIHVPRVIWARLATSLVGIAIIGVRIG
jgi:hypothetical protein